MAKYVLTYRSKGAMPESEEEVAEVMAAWGAWFEQIGGDLVDGGNPIGQSKTVATDGSVQQPQQRGRHDHRRRGGVRSADGHHDQRQDRGVSPLRDGCSLDRQPDDPSETGKRQQHQRRA